MSRSRASKGLDDPQQFLADERACEKKHAAVWQQPVSLNPLQINELWAHLLRSLYSLRDTYVSELKKAGCQLAPQDLPTMKILLFGSWGVGKTSYVNTLCSVFRNSMEPVDLLAAAAKGDGSRVTTNVQTVRIGGLLVELVDMWGFEPTSDFDEHIRNLDAQIQGIAPAGTARGDVPVPPPPPSAGAPAAAALDIASLRVSKVTSGIHSSIMVCSADGVLNTANEAAGHLNIDAADAAAAQPAGLSTSNRYYKCVRKLQYAEIPLLSVVTRVDRLEGAKQLRDHPHRSYISDAVRNMLRTYSEYFAVPLCETFPVLNYSSNTERNLYIEVMALLPLMEAMQNALLTVRKRIRQFDAKLKPAHK